MLQPKCLPQRALEEARRPFLAQLLGVNWSSLRTMTSIIYNLPAKTSGRFPK
jgi:hypothetical protein